MRPACFAFLLAFLLFEVSLANAQKTTDSSARNFSIPRAGFTIYPYQDSSINIRFLALSQFWTRYGMANPGTMYRGEKANTISDLLIRRLSLITAFEITQKILLLTNVNAGINAGSQPGNLSLSLMDAHGEYYLSNHVAIGAGLHLWNGFSRLSMVNVGTLTNLDVPRFQAPYFQQLDLLGRTLGMFAHGRVKRLDYRVSVNEPFVPVINNYAPNSGNGSPSMTGSGEQAGYSQPGVAYFNQRATTKLFTGYFKWQFWGKEFNRIPFENGDYIGRKNILNLGLGFAYRKNGMVSADVIAPKNADSAVSATNPVIVKKVSKHDITCLSADLFLSVSLRRHGAAFNLYGGYFLTSLGPNYYSVSMTAMSATQAAAGSGNISGGGLGVPAAGTGSSWYLLAGYVFPGRAVRTAGHLGIFGSVQYSRFEALADRISILESGLNWFLDGHGLKATLQYRNRPVFTGLAATADQASTAKETDRKGEFILQLQANF